MRLTRRAALTLPLALPACAQACPATPAAALPLRLVDGYPIVPASIAGRPVSLLLDTGAQGMLVTPELAESLSLPLRGLVPLYGTGGSSQARLYLLPGLRLGGTPMPDQLAPAAPLPIGVRTDPPLAGLLGASLLSRFDLTIDVPGGRLALAFPDDCPPPQGTSAALEVSPRGEPYMPVRVNGHTLLALFDTGTRATIIDEGVAARLGITAPASANTARGIDGQRVAIGHTTVQLAIGDAAPTATPVSVSALQLDRGDMLLGLDSIIGRRLWLSYARARAVFA